MNQRTLHVLEYDKVKQHILGFAVCSLGKEQIDAMQPFSVPEAANAELSAVDEAVRLLYRQGPLPFGGVTDIRPQLRKASIGGVLGTEELNRIVDFIGGGRRVRQAVLNAAENIDIPLLSEQGDALYDARQTEVEIRQAVAEDGTVFDDASPELRKIRSSLKQQESQIRRHLEQMLRTHQKYLQDPVIAMRGNSFCLPVRVEFKNLVAGIVHDYSSSGATVFVEPQAVVEGTAKVRALKADEEREIERILQQLSGVVATIAEELEQNATVLARLDAWSAKAEYARVNRCEMPSLRTDGIWRLRQARHPLIARDAAVPVDLTLGDAFQLLIITGPNTGGKTVTLKTVGLLTLLAMSGCFIHTGTPSEIGWCDQIFADIGDEQSIEQSLSTFSSHMKNIVQMLSSVTRDSLVLLDELGAGTDPAEGAALSMAILDHLKNWGAKVVATTHYAELKAYAFKEPKAVNASVEFDVQTLRPTYRLMVGVPGRSNALAIASRLGLSSHVVESARSFLTTEDIRVEDLIAKMEAARRDAELLQQEAAEDRRAAQSLRQELETELSRVHGEADSVLAKATADAEAILHRAESEATRVIQELRQMRDSAQYKDHELVALRKSLEQALPGQPSHGQRKSRKQDDISVGAQVRVLSLGQKGEVLDKSEDGKQLTVQLGLLRMKVEKADLELVGGPPAKETVRSVKRGMPRTMSLQLDIRGDTVDDGVPKVDKYLDDAVVNGLARVTVVHGKGTGALRDGIRKYLSRHPHVKTWAPGGPGEGGDGATVVELR